MVKYMHNSEARDADIHRESQSRSKSDPVKLIPIHMESFLK